MSDTVDQLWRTFHRRLRYFIRKRVRDTDETEDILQEVFLKVHAQITTLNDSTKLEAWLYQICRRAIIDHYRRHRRTSEPAGLLERLPAAQPERSIHRELSACLRPMIDRLPARYRTPLRLSELEGLPQQQVARRLGLSLSGAKSRIQRGRQRLKALLLDCCHIEFDRAGSPMDYHQKAGNCRGCR